MLVTYFISIIQEKSTLHSTEIPKTKNFISALFPGEIINYIYKVRFSSFETLLTFLGPSFSWSVCPPFIIPIFCFRNTYAKKVRTKKKQKILNNHHQQQNYLQNKPLKCVGKQKKHVFASIWNFENSFLFLATHVVCYICINYLLLHNRLPWNVAA